MAMLKEVLYGPRMFQSFIDDQNLQIHSECKIIVNNLFLSFCILEHHYERIPNTTVLEKNNHNYQRKQGW